MLYLGADHAGYKAKEKVRKYLDKNNIKYYDASPKLIPGDDYPDYAKWVGEKVAKSGKGILVCGTGIGISIAANRIKGVRAALCRTKKEVEISRKHNNANILALSGSEKQPDQMIKAFLNTKFEGGRHLRRVKKIDS